MIHKLEYQSMFRDDKTYPYKFVANLYGYTFFAIGKSNSLFKEFEEGGADEY